MLNFLTKTMIEAKDKVNVLPRIFDDYLFKALNPELTLEEKLVYIHKLQLHLMILSNMLNDIETELTSTYDTQSRTNYSA
mgnify:CR=1 FL=1